MSKLTTRNLPPTRTDKRIGLALGGGGARGLAHIAILEVLDELGIKPAVIAGTSIGAIYGAAYAAGFSATHIRALTEDTLGSRWGMIRQLLAARADPTNRMLRVLPVRSALLKPEAVLDLVLPSGMPRAFESLDIPLKLTATGLASHEAVVFTSGDLRSAIAASMAIPVVFSPVDRDGALHLDGGLANPCPYDLILQDCDISIAVDVSGAPSEDALGKAPSALTVAIQTAQIIQKSITRERLRYRQPDIYLEIGLDGFGAFDFHKPREILKAAIPAKAALRTRLQRLLASDAAEVAP